MTIGELENLTGHQELDKISDDELLALAEQYNQQGKRDCSFVAFDIAHHLFAFARNRKGIP